VMIDVERIVCNIIDVDRKFGRLVLVLLHPIPIGQSMMNLYQLRIAGSTNLLTSPPRLNSSTVPHL